MGIIIRQSIKGTIVNYVGAFIGFLTTLFVVTKYLSQEDYGLIRVITEAGLLLCAIGQFGTSFSAIKYFPYFKTDDKKHNGFFFYLILLPLIGFFIISSLALIFRHPIQNYYSENAQEFVHYFYWIFPLAFFMIYQAVFETYSNILLRIVVPKFVREVLIRILTVIAYFLYAFNIINLDWLVISYVAIFAIAALINLLYVAHIGNISFGSKTTIRKPVKKNILYFTLYMILASIGGNIVLKIDVFMVSGMIGLSATGIYTVAYFMAAIVEMPARSLFGVSTPIAAEYFKKKEIGKINDLYKKITLNQFIIGCFIFLLIWINIDNIFTIIPNGDDYIAGKWVVFFIGLSKLIDSTCGFGNSILSISKYYYYTLFFTFFLAGLTILGNQLLIPHFGISGAAIATMVALIIYNISIIFLIKKKMGIHPFSIRILKIAIISFFVFLINYFWFYLGNPFLDGIVKSILLGGAFFAVVYLLKISPEINQTVQSFFKLSRPKKS